MADTKITALAAIGANPIIPSTFPLPMVDLTDTSMAASGTTKKVTVNQILGAGGTATLASATITGNLTVDTSTFAVDASNNRVFVGTAPISTAYPFYVTRGGTAGSIAQFTDGTAQTLTIDSAAGGLLVGNANNGYLEFVANSLAQYRIAPLGVFSWYDGAGGTRMTLNSTGLGVGVSSPSYRLDVTDNTTNIQLRLSSSNNNGTSLRFVNTGTSGRSWQIGSGFAVTAGNFEIYDVTAAANRFSIDSSGNVGVGVTPSAWAIGKVIQIGATSGAFHYGASGQSISGVNAYYDTTWKYASNGFANYYQQSSGIHSWFNAPSGTAGNAITWTQAMTLNAAGSLVLGAAAVATTATDGFLYIPGCAGTPTGTPTAQTGRVPLVVDTTNNKLYFYSGGSWVAAN